MKLTGLDKGEQGREEQEAAELVRAYKAHVGALKAVVGGVNGSDQGRREKKGAVGDLLGMMDEAPPSHGVFESEPWKATKVTLPIIPELAITMPIRTATASEGGLVSTQACGICGMKREERVAKVDVGIEDSFGEWWIEKTNLHVGCWRFWEGFKGRLNQR